MVYMFLAVLPVKNESGRRNNHMDKPVEDQIRIPGGMPKIVDDDTFAKVQSILASRKRHGRRNGKRKYLLSGFVYCGICGHKYCGDSMQSGKERITVGTYFCNNRKNHGIHECNNLGIQQKPLEELVLRKIEEIVFDEDQISNIVEAYYNLCKDTAGDVGEKLRTMRLNLKTIEQKISNIVNVIANTGSAALANQLMLLENEKEVLDFQIREEERNAEQSRLDETEIRVAFHQAQQMFRSGELPQMEQIINLYLDRVDVYPEYVEIHINNVQPVS